MRLHNVIVVYDVYAVAETPEEARKVIMAAIQSAHEEPLRPSESNALPVSREREVREAWRDEKPYVADDVSDADFASCKGKTTFEVFQMLHTKQPEAVAATKQKKGA